MELKERLFAQIALKLELLTQEQVADLFKIQSAPGERRHLSKIAADTGLMKPTQIKRVQAHRKWILERLQRERAGAHAQVQQVPVPTGNAIDAAVIADLTAEAVLDEPEPNPGKPAQQGALELANSLEIDSAYAGSAQQNALTLVDGIDIADRQPNGMHPYSWDRGASTDLYSELFDDTPQPPPTAPQTDLSARVSDSSDSEPNGAPGAEPFIGEADLLSDLPEQAPTPEPEAPELVATERESTASDRSSARESHLGEASLFDEEEQAARNAPPIQPLVSKPPVWETDPIAASVALAEQSRILEPEAFDRPLSSRPPAYRPSVSSVPPMAKDIPVTGPGGGSPKAVRVFKRPVRDSELVLQVEDDEEEAAPAATPQARPAELPPQPPRAGPPEIPAASTVYHVYMPPVSQAPAPVCSAFPPARAPSITHHQVPEARDAVAERETDDAKLKAKEKEPFLVRALLLARQKGASDLHLHSGAPVLARIDGNLSVLSSAATVSAADAEKVIAQIMTDEQWAELAQQGEVDFALQTQDGGRYRVNAYRQQRGMDIVFRLIPSGRITLESLGLPSGLKKLAEFRNGIVLCTGPMGCGKSTTLAALLHALISTRREHVLTIENPIEHVLTRVKAHVTQRQIGTHTGSFSRALRAALREDPDVIAITELRDRETISLAMSAAETGHLVLGTLHTGSATQTVNRIISAFPADEQAQARVMLSESLRAVVSQRLVPRASGSGRVPAVEVLMVTAAVAAVIREGQTFKIPSMMQTGRAQGMITLDASLQQLVGDGAISSEEARRHAVDRSRFGGAAPESEGGKQHGD